MSLRTSKKIAYVNYGIANSYSNRIEVNAQLRENPKLLRYVLAHERGHKVGFDLWHDMNIKKYKTILYLMLFVAKHPRMWTDLSPVQYRKNKIVYDLNVWMLYGIVAVLIAVLILMF